MRIAAARRWDADAFVVALAVSRDGTHAAAALGDGTVQLIDLADPDGAPRSVRAHDGACLALARDLDGSGFLSGGDDGRLVRIAPGAAAETLAHVKDRWIEHVDAEPGARLRAYAAGRDVVLLDAAGRSPRSRLEHPSTVGGLAFAPRGRRVAAAHYGGVSLWWTGSSGPPLRLPWKGSHLAVVWHPAGTHVLSAMQEPELHGWRLKDGADMRMSGYPTKIRSFAWTARGRYLATAGADAVVCWPFFGGGPWDRAPRELRVAGGRLVTAVASHPAADAVVAGLADGSVHAAPLDGGAPAPLVPAGGGPVSALAWSADGRHILSGTESGRIDWLSLARAPAG